MLKHRNSRNNDAHFLHSQVFLSMCIISMLFMLFVSLPCFGKGAKGDKELLKLLSVGHEANLSSLRTWCAQAKLVFKEVSKDRESVMVRTTDFQFDRSVGAIRADSIWQHYEDVPLHKNYEDMPSHKTRMHQVREILTYDIYARIDISLSPEGHRLSRKSSLPHGNIHVTSSDDDPCEAGQGDASIAILPLKYFYHYGALEEHYRDWNIHDWKGSLSIKRDEDIVIFRIELCDYFNQFEYDLTKGCNQVRYSSGWISDNLLDYEKTVEWEKVNRVFVPSSILEISYDKDGNIISRRETTFSNNRVNEPIDPKVFKPEELAADVMSAGDVMMDYVHNIKKVYLGNGSWEESGSIMR